MTKNKKAVVAEGLIGFLIIGVAVVLIVGLIISAIVSKVEKPAGAPTPKEAISPYGEYCKAIKQYPIEDQSICDNCNGKTNLREWQSREIPPDQITYYDTPKKCCNVWFGQYCRYV